MMEPVIQVTGVILVLLGYVLGQTGRVDASTRSYLVINLDRIDIAGIGCCHGPAKGILHPQRRLGRNFPCEPRALAERDHSSHPGVLHE